MLGTTALEINKNIINKFSLPTHDTKIWLSLHDFFLKKDNYNILLQFLKSDSKISLRIIDYFLTTYCYINKVENNNMNIFIEYKDILKKYHKKYFDPCSRGIKIPFFYDKDYCVITTICQLNFFKWFVETETYKIFLNLYSNIKQSMKNKEVKKPKTRTSFEYNKDNVVYCSTSKNIVAMFD
jgi:hypothetical protein